MRNKSLFIVFSAVFFVFVSLIAYTEDNLVKNGSFENVFGNRAPEWAARSYFEDTGISDYIVETGIAHSGNHSFTIRNNSANDGRIFQFVNVKPLTVYRLSGWIKVNNLVGEGGAEITVSRQRLRP
jgi:dolichyl-phosphate-mannose-protein mannosyltransferase